MQLKDILLKEKLDQQLWENLALRVKESRWQTVREWLETRISTYPTNYKKELLWLLQTLK